MGPPPLRSGGPEKAKTRHRAGHILSRYCYACSFGGWRRSGRSAVAGRRDTAVSRRILGREEWLLFQMQHDELIERFQRKITTSKPCRHYRGRANLILDFGSVHRRKPEGVEFAEHAKRYLEGLFKEANSADCEDPIRVQR
jgi:hypothetical protein